MRGLAALRVATYLIAGGALALTAASAPLGGGEALGAQGEACRASGDWLDPASGGTLALDWLAARMAERRVVLLGEEHSNVEHHRWQLHTLAALYGRKSRMVIGFEMFPRRVQPVLDRWVEGDLDTAAFLEAVDWRSVWGFDPELYLPLFHFARQNRIPMVALNIERDLVARVGQEGWAAISKEQRGGLSDPAPASAAYRQSLASVYAEKRRLGIGSEEAAEGEERNAAPELAEIMASEGFTRFVEAQLTWDRAMAEALAGAADRSLDALIVGIVGRGHAERGYGVPHQLADIGFNDTAVLLPVSTDAVCGPEQAYLADAVFVVDRSERFDPPTPKPRLGVMIEESEVGVRVLQVLGGSVAEAAGLRPGDVVVEAAEVPVARVADLTGIIRRQAPGTWLPLSLRRNGEKLDLLAKFPAHPPDVE